MKVIDLSHKLNNETPIYPGDPSFELKKSADFIKDGYNMFNLQSNLHVGTHVEVSMHMDDTNDFISEFGIDDFIGKAKVLNFKNKSDLNWDVSFDAIIEPNDIVIIYTNYSKNYLNDTYFTKHPILTNDFINKLIEKKIKMLAIDFPSPDKEPYEGHLSLFKNKISIVENLTNVELLLNYNNIMFFAVPIKIDAEASLTRAFAVCFE